MTDRRIVVPKPERRVREVSGFDVEPGEPVEALAQPEPEATPPDPADSRPKGRSEERPAPAKKTPAKGRRPKQDVAEPKPTRKLKVFATIGQDLAVELPGFAKDQSLTQTEVLLTAVLKHSAELAAEYDKDEAERWAALGLRQPARKRPTGRMQKQFYLTEQELQVIDQGVIEAGYESRSAYIDELLRREMQLGEPIASI